MCCVNDLFDYHRRLGGDLIHNIRGPTKDYVLSELERRKGELRTQLVWIGAQKEPGYTSRTWKWVNGTEQKYKEKTYLQKKQTIFDDFGNWQILWLW